MRTNWHNIDMPRAKPVKNFLLAWLGHLFNNHNWKNMFLYSDKDGNGWACPFCDWCSPDTASYKMMDSITEKPKIPQELIERVKRLKNKYDWKWNRTPRENSYLEAIDEVVKLLQGD